MTQELYDYIEQNKDLFNLWIETKAMLEPSADIFKPLIPVFIESNPGVNLYSCKECILDMLIWAKIQLKNKPNGKERIAKK